MRQWAYRATTKKVGLLETSELATEEKFLCRSAFNKAKAFNTNVKHVAFGDLIHIYYRDGKHPNEIGAFEVVNDTSERFGGVVERTALLIVRDPAFEVILGNLGRERPGAQGYKPDVKLEKFTGWLLRPRKDVTQLAFPTELFPHGYQGSLREMK